MHEVNATLTGPVDLETHLNKLIAEKEGISPEEVTVEYIHKQREKYIYPNLYLDCSPELISFTINELDEIESLVDTILRVTLGEEWKIYLIANAGAFAVTSTILFSKVAKSKTHSTEWDLFLTTL